MYKIFIPILLLFLIPPTSLTDSGVQDQIRQIDDETSGSMGVYIKNLKNGIEVEHNADRDWYLASVIKIPVAIAILQKVESGELSLDDELILRESDKVDGAGVLHWTEAGAVYTIEELVSLMLKDSDSTATDMLIRLIGEEEFNEQVRDRIVGNGLNHITTILQVRYEAYSEVHANASNLTNLDIIRLRGISSVDDRYDELVRLMGVDRSELQAGTIVDAFMRYYEGGLNSGRLGAMGEMFERLVKGELLNEENTELLIEIMADISTGDRRIKAGLPEGTRFAQKTGTLIGRACNMGLVYPPHEEKPIIVAVCLENYDQLSDAEEAFRRVGETVSEYWLQ